MTKKRFYTEGRYVMQDKEVYVICNGEHSADVVATALNELLEENKQLKQENKRLRRIIESNNQLDYIDYLEKQNERLKERIAELASNDKIVFMNEQDYEIF